MREQPTTRKDFQVLSELRAKEADILVRNRQELGAYYLGGYAIECALKACIAKKTRRHEFPPKKDYVEKIYSHKLEVLLKLAGLEKQLEEDMRHNSVLTTNWGVVKLWSESRARAAFASTSFSAAAIFLLLEPTIDPQLA